MNNIQTLLFVVVIALTVIFIVIGIQVILIIIDLRRALKRLNSILDDAILGGGLIKPDKLTSIVEMVRKGKKMKTRGSSSSGEEKKV